MGIISFNGIIITILLPKIIKKNIECSDYLKTFVESNVPTFVCIWALGILCLIAILPFIYLILMGSHYKEGQLVLMILCIPVPISILTFISTILFNAQKRLDREFIYILLMAFVNLLISIILIPRLGTLGAAIGTVGGLLTVQILTIWDQYKFLEVPFYSIRSTIYATILIGIVQCVVGVHPWLRILWFIISLYFLVFLFRHLKMVNSILILNIFKGRLLPVGIFINRILVPTALNR